MYGSFHNFHDFNTIHWIQASLEQIQNIGQKQEIMFFVNMFFKIAFVKK